MARSARRTPTCSASDRTASSTGGAPPRSPTTCPGSWPSSGGPATRWWSAGWTTTQRPSLGPGGRGRRRARAMDRRRPRDRGDRSAEPRAAIGERTRLVAVTAASNLLGTKPPVPGHRRRRPRGRRARLRRRRALRRPRVRRRRRARGGLLRVLAVQGAGAALRRAGGRARTAGDGAAGQAAAVHQRRARAVRVRHAAVRGDGRRHGGGRLPRRHRAGRRCRTAGPAARLAARGRRARAAAAPRARGRAGRARAGRRRSIRAPPTAPRRCC